MPGLVESASAVMGGAQRRLDVAAVNIANGSTPGFRRLSAPISFADSSSQLRARTEQGKLEATGRPLDLAVVGSGFFKVRVGERFFYTRQGAFVRGADGTVTTPQGYVLQQAGGGDLVLDRSAVAVSADGVMTDEDRPVGRIALFQPAQGNAAQPIDGTLFTIADAEEMDAPHLRSGALEASTVELGGEMALMMAALREAEAGAKLIQAYDDLTARAITTFGEAGR